MKGICYTKCSINTTLGAPSSLPAPRHSQRKCPEAAGTTHHLAPVVRPGAPQCKASWTVAPGDEGGRQPVAGLVVVRQQWMPGVNEDFGTVLNPDNK